jgi:hypothetical protein
LISYAQPSRVYNSFRQPIDIAAGLAQIIIHSERYSPGREKLKGSRIRINLIYHTLVGGEATAEQV